MSIHFSGDANKKLPLPLALPNNDVGRGDGTALRDTYGRFGVPVMPLECLMLAADTLADP